MKKFWLTILAVALIGLALICVGAGLGGFKYSFYVDENGFHRENEVLEMREEKLNGFKNIDVDLSSANLNFVEGDEFKIEIMNERNDEIKYSVEDDTLKVSQKPFFAIFSFWVKTPTVTVYTPANAEFDNVKIQLSSGKANVDGMTANTCCAKLSSGNAKLKNIDAETSELVLSSGKLVLDGFKTDSLDYKISSGNVEIANLSAKTVNGKVMSGQLVVSKSNLGEFASTVSSGKVVMEGIASDSLDCSVSSGSVNISGELNGKTKLHVSSGSLTLDIDGSSKDYNRVLTATSGSVRVDGQKQEGVFDIGAEKTIEAKVTSGKIEINFNK